VDEQANIVMDEDDDVLWNGSPLHQHLLGQGLEVGVPLDQDLAMQATATIDGVPPLDNEISGKGLLADKSPSHHRQPTAAVQTLEGGHQHQEEAMALQQASCSLEEVLEQRHFSLEDESQAAAEFERKIQAKSELIKSGRSLAWPEDQHTAILEVQVARLLLQSDLLVQEDQDFLNNFVLTEDAIVNYEQLLKEREASKTRSTLADVLFFSGSVAAVAGAVYFLSERTRVAATAAAALLPTALAAASSARTNSGGGGDKSQNSDLEELVKVIIEDMQMFKRLARKSLNLLQGMEMVHSGHMFAINSATGNAYVNSGGGGSSIELAEKRREIQKVQGEGGGDLSATKLDRALSDRAAFPALRKTAYECTVQLIVAYRQAVETLMEVSPLAEHVDLKDHYIAFIDLDGFGILTDKAISGNDISVKTLRDTVQVALVQQSEYLRRFCLVFNDKVRDCDAIASSAAASSSKDSPSGGGGGVDASINKPGVLKHVREMADTLGKINSKLSKVFEYHQAMGIDVSSSETEHLQQPSVPKTAALTHASPAASAAETEASAGKATSALDKKRRQNLDLVPLRTVYTSLFSTGLHLQNSLLKVRELEKIFDAMEGRKNLGKDSGSMMSSTASALKPLPEGPSQVEIIRWLQGFQDIQGELNACVGCLEEGVAQIDVLNTKGAEGKDSGPATTQADPSKDCQTTVGQEASKKAPAVPVIPVVDTNNDPREHLDEVFEAVIEASSDDNNDQQNDYDPQECREFSKQVQSEKRLLRELKHVLVDKASEHEQREAAAFARMVGGQAGAADQPNFEPTFKAEDNQVIKCNPENYAASHVARSDPFCSRNQCHRPTEEGDQEAMEEGEKDGTGVDDDDEDEDHVQVGFADSFVAPTAAAAARTSRLPDVAVPADGEEDDDVIGGGQYLPLTSTSSTDDESSSSSSYSSDDRGTVKMCGATPIKKEDSVNDDDDEDLTRQPSNLPRSVSGQLLTEDDFSSTRGDDEIPPPSGDGFPTNGFRGSPSVVSLPSLRQHHRKSHNHRRERRQHRPPPHLSQEAEEKMRIIRQKRELFGRNESVDSQECVPPPPPPPQTVADKGHSIADIRSISTPDLKRIAGVSGGSSCTSYVSLDDGSTPKPSVFDDLTNGSDDDGEEEIEVNDDDGDSAADDSSSNDFSGKCESEDSADSSSDWGSADELDHHVLKTYKRPMRPAAAKAASVKAAVAAATPVKANGGPPTPHHPVKLHQHHITR